MREKRNLTLVKQLRRTNDKSLHQLHLKKKKRRMNASEDGKFRLGSILFEKTARRHGTK